MRVIEPSQFYGSKKMKRRSHKGILLFTLVVLLIALYGVYAYNRPIPAVKAETFPVANLQPKDVSLAWPAYGQAAIGAIDYGVLSINGQQNPVPTASVAKIITAIMVLKQKPLPANGQWPVLTLTDDDVSIYQNYAATDGSVTLVQSGEQITEYQALQAMLLPSANNFADTLAKWAYGSMDNYVAETNKYLASLGIKNTHVADASGFSSQTVGTAEDLVKIGELALSDKTIADIVSQKQADIPVAGIIQNVNVLLGQENIIGIKTGNTDQAGGCFLFAATHGVDGQKVTIIGAVLGAPTLGAALRDSKTLLVSSYNDFSKVIAVAAGQKIVHYSTAWGQSANAVTKEEYKPVIWNATPPKNSAFTKQIDIPTYIQATVGGVNSISGNKKTSVPVVLDASITKPTIWWRLTHPTRHASTSR